MSVTSSIKVLETPTITGTTEQVIEEMKKHISNFTVGYNDNQEIKILICGYLINPQKDC